MVTLLPSQEVGEPVGDGAAVGFDGGGSLARGTQVSRPWGEYMVYTAACLVVRRRLPSSFSTAYDSGTVGSDVNQPRVSLSRDGHRVTPCARC